MIRLCTLLGIPGLVVLAAAASADQAPVLDHNPFSRPPSEESHAPGAVVASDRGSRWSLALLATLVGPTEGYADVAGHIMKPGDELEGYTLLDVEEDNATFLKDGQEFTVYVRAETEEESDE